MAELGGDGSDTGGVMVFISFSFLSFPHTLQTFATWVFSRTRT